MVKAEVSFVLDGARSIQTLTENPMNTIEDIHAAFLEAVSTDVIESPALDQLVSPETKSPLCQRCDPLLDAPGYHL